MWKKEEAPKPAPRTPQKEKPMNRSEPSSSPPGTGERATIGRSITIRGDVSGNEDLLIQGEIDGSVELKQQTVTVGKEGKVKADITGRVVTVEGQVEGDLRAEEQVVLRASAQVQGDITAPRVVLEDGANFRGGIDMGSPRDQGTKKAPEPTAGGKPTPEFSKPPEDSSKKGSDSTKEEKEATDTAGKAKS